jgi:hypothetical protein
VALRLWSAGEVPVLPQPSGDWLVPMPTELVPVAMQLGGLLWLPAYLALLLGQWRAARAVAALALLAAVGGAVVQVARTLSGAYLGSALGLTVSSVAYLLFDAVLVLALTAYATGAPPRRRPWLLALPAALAGAGLVHVTAWVLWPAAYLFDWAGIWCLVTVVAALAWAVAARASGRPDRVDPWPLALASLAGGALALRVVTMLPVVDSGAPDLAARLASGLIGAAAVLAAGVPLAVRAARTMRRLAAVPTAGAEP